MARIIASLAVRGITATAPVARSGVTQLNSVTTWQSILDNNNQDDWPNLYRHTAPTWYGRHWQRHSAATIDVDAKVANLIAAGIDEHLLTEEERLAGVAEPVFNLPTNSKATYVCAYTDDDAEVFCRIIALASQQG